MKLNLSLGFRILPCRHGDRCNECAEQSRLRTVEAEKKREKQEAIQRDYAHLHSISVLCEDCGDRHPPHARIDR